MAQDFFRKPTEDEKRDFTDVGPMRQRTAKEIFLAELGKKRLEAGKKKLPFFKKAAMDDFDEYYREQAKISMRTHGYVDATDIKKIEIDWDKYSSPNNIEFIEQAEVRDAHVSKKHPFDVFVKTFRYKYIGYGEEGSYNISVMEEEVYAVKRARAKYENKPELEDVSLTEKQSFKYGNKEKVEVNLSEDNPIPVKTRKTKK